MNKAIKVKPMFYSVILEPLKVIALEYGYNLVIHGSMNRDLDLILIPWKETCCEPIKVIKAIAFYLNGNLHDQRTASDKEPIYLKPVINGAGRKSVLISLNRSNRFNEYEDDQYYLDISVTPKGT